MKVCHLVAGDLTGGAARGAYWLHLASRELGIESTLLTNVDREYKDPNVSGLKLSTYDWLQSRIKAKASRMLLNAYPHREKWIFNLGFDGINYTKSLAYQEADIIHLHWVNGLVNVQSLKRIKKPVVWTLRDMWPFTGGCHYTMGCEGYKVGCGNCQQLKSNRKWDITRLANAYKKRSLPKQLNLVGISNWITTCASESKLFGNIPIKTISNNIAEDHFFPVDRAEARKALNAPVDKKIILIGAHQVNNFYKGFDLFLSAIEKVNRNDIHLLIFGSVSQDVLDKLKMNYTSLGFIEDDAKLRLAYSSADLFVAPSRMDAFGKTLAESLFCGTPVVCFDATGPKDIIQHKITGYKAAPFDVKDLANGIEWVLDRSHDEELQMRTVSRKHATTNFSSPVIANQYLNLYEDILSASR